MDKESRWINRETCGMICDNCQVFIVTNFTKTEFGSVSFDLYFEFQVDGLIGNSGQ